MTLPAGKRLRQMIEERRALLVPGVMNALAARIAEDLGYEALYITGAGVTNALLGLPDVGFISPTQMADTIACVRNITELPLIVDGDTGFGNALNVQRTVRTFERMGAAAIQLEDQTMPKRCGHLNGKNLVSTGEMIGKIKAATDARASDDFIIIARTDAIAVEGFEAALDRAAAYAEAGADMLFVEAPRTVAEMEQIVAALGKTVPLMANMVEGGKTPPMNARDLEKIGYSLVIFPGGLTRAVAHTSRAYFESLLRTGSNQAFSNQMFDFAGINQIVGTNELLETGSAYDEKRFSR